MSSSGFAHGAQTYVGKTPIQDITKFKKKKSKKLPTVYKFSFMSKSWVSLGTCIYESVAQRTDARALFM